MWSSLISRQFSCWTVNLLLRPTSRVTSSSGGNNFQLAQAVTRPLGCLKSQFEVGAKPIALAAISQLTPLLHKLCWYEISEKSKDLTVNWDPCLVGDVDHGDLEAIVPRSPGVFGECCSLQLISERSHRLHDQGWRSKPGKGDRGVVPSRDHLLENGWRQPSCRPRQTQLPGS